MVELLNCWMVELLPGNNKTMNQYNNKAILQGNNKAILKNNTFET